MTRKCARTHKHLYCIAMNWNGTGKATKREKKKGGGGVVVCGIVQLTSASPCTSPPSLPPAPWLRWVEIEAERKLRVVVRPPRRRAVPPHVIVEVEVHAARHVRLRVVKVHHVMCVSHAHERCVEGRNRKPSQPPIARVVVAHTAVHLYHSMRTREIEWE